ncbi:MAG: hypothetical protein Q8876_02380 [Bacillota bacterium]|nr:hypothetical protein [Bacillota bacterium]
MIRKMVVAFISTITFAVFVCANCVSCFAAEVSKGAAATGQDMKPLIIAGVALVVAIVVIIIAIIFRPKDK